MEICLFHIYFSNKKFCLIFKGKYLKSKKHIYSNIYILFIYILCGQGDPQRMQLQPRLYRMACFNDLYSLHRVSCHSLLYLQGFPKKHENWKTISRLLTDILERIKGSAFNFTKYVKN